MTDVIQIGDILICPADETDPCRCRLLGPLRAQALRRLKLGTLPPSIKAWFAPTEGSARELTAEDMEQIDWMGLP